MRKFLEIVIADEDIHARFLNTMSLMEHIGSRKILLSQARGLLSAKILQHIAEETRHASFFRHMAERIGKRSMEYTETDLLAGSAARMYMGRLDAGVTMGLGPEAVGMAYPYVTAAIELRALWLYTIYDDVLESLEIGISLKRLLVEEKSHLTEIGNAITTRDACWEKNLERFTRLECEIFDSWFERAKSSAKSELFH